MSIVGCVSVVIGRIIGVGGWGNGCIGLVLSVVGIVGIVVGIIGSVSGIIVRVVRIVIRVVGIIVGIIICIVGIIVGIVGIIIRSVNKVVLVVVTALLALSLASLYADALNQRKVMNAHCLQGPEAPVLTTELDPMGMATARAGLAKATEAIPCWCS